MTDPFTGKGANPFEHVNPSGLVEIPALALCNLRKHERHEHECEDHDADGHYSEVGSLAT
jgi:hypothetical protein